MKKRILLLIAVLIMALTPILAVPSVVSYAGQSNEVIFGDAVALADSPLYNQWTYNSDEGITITDKTSINFSEDADIYSTIVCNTLPQVNEQDMPVSTFEGTVQITSISGEKSFGFYFGVTRLSFNASAATSSTYAGSIYVGFSKVGANYTVSVIYFEQDNARVLVDNQVIGTSNICHVKADQYYDEQIVIYVGNDGGYSAETEIFDSDDVTGVLVKPRYFAIGGREENTDQNKISAKVTHIAYINNYYARPENTMINEKFDVDYVNAEEWVISGNICIKDGAMYFINANQGTYASTTHKYSNFEMTFDIPYIKRTYDAATDASLQFGVAIGNSAATPTELQGQSVCFGKEKGYDVYFFFFDGLTYNKDADKRFSRVRYGDSWSIERYFNLGKYHAVPNDSDFSQTANKNYFADLNEFKKYDIFDAECAGERVVNCKISMIDGVIKFFLKWDTDQNYKLFHEDNLGKTLTGFISFFGGWTNTTNRVTNVAFDNIKITNKDKNPNFVTDIGFRKTGFQNEGDYDYVDPYDPSDLVGGGSYEVQVISGGESEDAGCAMSITLDAVLLIPVVLIGMSVFMIFFRKKEEK